MGHSRSRGVEGCEVTDDTREFPAFRPRSVWRPTTSKATSGHSDDSSVHTSAHHSLLHNHYM